MTPQEVFDVSAKFLLDLNTIQCVDEHAACVYRNTKGNKCAVGNLIPDEFYDKNMEGIPFTIYNNKEEFIECNPEVIFPPWIYDNFEFMRLIQELHDCFLKNKELIKNELIEFAVNHNLKVNF